MSRFVVLPNTDGCRMFLNVGLIERITEIPARSAACMVAMSGGEFYEVAATFEELSEWFNADFEFLSGRPQLDK